jgi:hypothetical protein
VRVMKLKALSIEVRAEGVVGYSLDLPVFRWPRPVLIWSYEGCERIERFDCDALVNLVREPAVYVWERGVIAGFEEMEMDLRGFQGS